MMALFNWSALPTIAVVLAVPLALALIGGLVDRSQGRKAVRDWHDRHPQP